MIKRTAALVGALALAGTASVSAQTWDDRLFVNITVGAQVGSTTSTNITAPTVYNEAAEITLTRKLDSKPYFDVTVGRPLRGNLGAAFSFGVHSAKADGSVTSLIPDPIFFNRLRSVASTIPDMDHSERWFAFLATWFIPVDEKSDVIVSGGPAFASVDHELISSVAVAEAGGGPSVTATLETVSKTFAGFQIGADYRYMITPRVGAGGYLGFTRASGTIAEGTDLTLGGFRIGVGARVRF